MLRASHLLRRSERAHCSGRLYQSPDEIFATGMRARATELGGDAALLDRAAVHILLELIRELVRWDAARDSTLRAFRLTGLYPLCFSARASTVQTNYAEDFPDDPPISDADVDECMSELDFEGEGIGMCWHLAMPCMAEVAPIFCPLVFHDTAILSHYFAPAQRRFRSTCF